ncbi:MAG: sulfatase-like hydrolase/transferase [Anaerolineae bacterium]|nr:sulfatase-like hydrolase/transferase [Anaerolineae bacterium]
MILLYTDQQRWDTIGAAGNPHIHTPNLDRLAAQGALFESAFCNSPVCMPSRHSLLSGRYPSALGSTCNGIEMREDVLTLPRVLKPYGYHVANIGKLHFKNHSNRDHRQAHPDYGFDTLILSDEPGCYDDAYIKWVAAHDPSQVWNCRCATPPAWEGPPVNKHPRNTHEPYLFEGPEELTHSAFVAEESVEFVRRHREESFFLIAGFYAPHAPLNPPRRFVELYDPASLPLPHMAPGENTLGLSQTEWQTVKAHYYALISHVDNQVGRILRALDEAGLEEDTLVIFTSDHGEHLGDHGRVQKGPPGLDSCAHVPLIMRYPHGIAGGERHAELVEQVDLAPTVLDWCGVQTPPEMQGRSLQPLLRGSAYVARPSVYIEHRYPFRESWKTVRTAALKYCAGREFGRREVQELLFDLARDPHELSNVAPDPAYAGELDVMRAELVRRSFDVESQYPLRTGQY